MQEDSSFIALEPHNPPFIYTGSEAALAMFKQEMVGRGLGLSPWPDDLLYKVFAFGLVRRFPEPYVSNPTLVLLVNICQWTFGIYEGAKANEFHINNIRAKVIELTRLGNKTPWLPSLMNRYHLKGWEKLDYSDPKREFTKYLDSLIGKKRMVMPTLRPTAKK